jgi:hypothetical protein
LVRKEIKTVADLKGLKMRIGGTGGLAQLLGSCRRFPAATSSGAEGDDRRCRMVGPYDDEKLGFFIASTTTTRVGGRRSRACLVREQGVRGPAEGVSVDPGSAEANIDMTAIRAQPTGEATIASA